jgi:hypothetical protein
MTDRSEMTVSGFAVCFSKCVIIEHPIRAYVALIPVCYVSGHKGPLFWTLFNGA